MGGSINYSAYEMETVLHAGKECGVFKTSVTSSKNRLQFVVL